MVLLASCIPQCESTIYIYTYPLHLGPPSTLSSHSSRSSVSAKLNFLCFIAAFHQLSILYIAVCVCQCYSLSSWWVRDKFAQPTTLSQEVFGNKGQVFFLTWRDWPESTAESPAIEPNQSRKHSISIALMVKNLPDNAGDREIRFNPWVRKIPWSRKWQPAPVFLPGKSHGQRTLVG